MYGNQNLLHPLCPREKKKKKEEKHKHKERCLKLSHPCIPATFQWLSVSLKVRLDAHVYMTVCCRRLVSAVCLPFKKRLAHHLKAICHVKLIWNGQKSEMVCFVIITNFLTLWMSLWSLGDSDWPFSVLWDSLWVSNHQRPNSRPLKTYSITLVSVLTVCSSATLHL